MESDEHRGTAIWARMIINLSDVKQKSESDADILPSFDQSNSKNGSMPCWLAGSNRLGPLDRCRNVTSGLIEKAVRRTAFAADWAPTCGAILSHLVSVGLMLCRYALHSHSHIRAAACRRHGARRRAVVGSNTQALVESLQARFLYSF